MAADVAALDFVQTKALFESAELAGVLACFLSGFLGDGICLSRPKVAQQRPRRFVRLEAVLQLDHRSLLPVLPVLHGHVLPRLRPRVLVAELVRLPRERAADPDRSVLL